MESKAKILGHPIHQMLIVFPLGLLATSIIFDLVHLATHHSAWGEVAYWMIVCGLIGGALAAVFGFIDWLAIPFGTRAKAIGQWHGIGNAVVMFLFLVSWWLRQPLSEKPNVAAFILSLIGVGLALVTGWLGGELVNRLGVGVDEGANLNASNSITGRRYRGSAL
jgi:uncharacterized membrane protein